MHRGYSWDARRHRWHVRYRNDVRASDATCSTQLHQQWACIPLAPPVAVLTAAVATLLAGISTACLACLIQSAQGLSLRAGSHRHEEQARAAAICLHNREYPAFPAAVSQDNLRSGTPQPGPTAAAFAAAPQHDTGSQLSWQASSTPSCTPSRGSAPHEEPYQQVGPHSLCKAADRAHAVSQLLSRGRLASVQAELPVLEMGLNAACQAQACHQVPRDPCQLFMRHMQQKMG